MRNEKRIDIGWMMIGIAFVISIGMFFYGFWLLSGALIIWIWALVLTPGARRQDRWIAADNKFRDWKRGVGARPDDAEMQLAANYYMLSDVWDIRAEDLPNCAEGRVAQELRPYIKSERELPRRYRDLY